MAVLTVAERATILEATDLIASECGHETCVEMYPDLCARLRAIAGPDHNATNNGEFDDIAKTLSPEAR